MVKDEQVLILMKLIHQEKTLPLAAAKAGMSEKAARKYRKSYRCQFQEQATSQMLDLYYHLHDDDSRQAMLALARAHQQ